MACNERGPVQPVSEEEYFVEELKEIKILESFISNKISPFISKLVCSINNGNFVPIVKFTLSG